jgi:hypothetical protein
MPKIAAILIMKIGFLKASLRLAFKKKSFPAPAALGSSFFHNLELLQK